VECARVVGLGFTIEGLGFRNEGLGYRCRVQCEMCKSCGFRI